MKIRIEHIEDDEKEVIIRCKEIDNYVLEIKSLLESKYNKMIGMLNGEKYFFYPNEIYYIEHIDNKTFAYMKKKVYIIAYSLEKLEQILDKQTFFRCSKSMILNLRHVKKFKSSMGNRIIATLDNEENVIISRHYSKILRAYLKEES